MDYLSLFLWLFIGSQEVKNTSGDYPDIRDDDLTIDQIQACASYHWCIEELRYFSQVYFEIYTSLDEAETACREAETAYLCTLSAPEWCNRPSRMAEWSPIIKGSVRLLKDFCGFKSKSSCCTLRNDYLKHSYCYADTREKLEDTCNVKYRMSLSKILSITDELEQKKQRFCTVKWFGKCVKSTTEKYCGKDAAEIFKSYAMKARKPAKRYIIKNENCGEDPYGAKIVKDTRNFCETFQFEWCRVHNFVDDEELLEYSGTTDEDIFLALCTAIRKSLGCISRGFKRCTFRRDTEKLEEMQVDETENEVCWMKESVFERYRGTVDCFIRGFVLQELSKCQPGFVSGIENITHPLRRYNAYFCVVFKYLKTCWISKASFLCGKEGKEVMEDIIELATENIQRKFQCKSYHYNRKCELSTFFHKYPRLYDLCT